MPDIREGAHATFPRYLLLDTSHRDHGEEVYFAFVGAMMIGAIPSLIPFPTPKQVPELFWEAHRKLFERIQPAAIVVYEEIAERAHLIVPPDTTVLLAPPDQALATDVCIVSTSPEAIPFLQHSSGTTGQKKGVMLSHRAVVTQVESYARANRGRRSNF